MKTLQLSAALFLAGLTGVFAQKPALPVDETTKKVVYTEVVPVEGVSQADLYARLSSWFKTYFPNPTSVIKSQDAVNGKITGQHGLYVFKTLEDGKQFKVGQVRYSIDVQVKDGRYKYTINDIFKLESPKVYIEEWLDESNPDKVNRFSYATQVDEHIKEVIGMLKEAMAKKPEVKKEDW